MRARQKLLLAQETKLVEDLNHLLQETRETLLRQERLASKIEVQKIRAVLEAQLALLARYQTEDNLTTDHMAHLETIALQAVAALGV